MVFNLLLILFSFILRKIFKQNDFANIVNIPIKTDNISILFTKVQYINIQLLKKKMNISF